MTEATATPVRPAPRADSRANVVIGVLVVSAFVMILNETILSVALRDLTVDLGVSTTTVQWLTSGFLLTMAVVIPTTGFLLERFTPRQVFLASLTLFSAGTLISALAPGFAVLLIGRVVQACGTAVMIPLLMTSVMRLVPWSAAAPPWARSRSSSPWRRPSGPPSAAPCSPGWAGGGCSGSCCRWRWPRWCSAPSSCG